MTNEELKSRLTTPGTKNNLQYPTQLRLYFEENAGFTDEELAIFRLRARGFGHFAGMDLLIDAAEGNCVVLGYVAGWLDAISTLIHVEKKKHGKIECESDE